MISVALNSVVDFKKKSVKPEDIIDGTAYVGLEHITGDGSISCEIVNNGELASNKFLFTDGHILYGKLRPYLSKTALPSFEGICSTDIIPLKPIESKISKEYLYYYLRTPFMVKYATVRCSGANLPRISPKEIEKFKIPLPPLDQQKKIAEILDAADDYRQKSKALITKYEELTQSLFLNMFGDDSGTLTELGAVIKLIGGGTPSKENEQFWNGDIPWASVKDLKSDRLVKTQDFITQLGVDNSTTKVIPMGSLIVATRMAVGRASICEMDVAINQDLKAVQIIGEVNIEYLLYLFQSKQHYFDSVSSGATVKGIKIDHITKLKIYLPDLSIQNKFADRVLAIEEQKAQAQASLAQAEDLFNSLLQRAFKGELAA